MIWIGIDPGKHTGLAVWDSDSRRLLEADTLLIHRALQRVDYYADNFGKSNIFIIFEDARKRYWFGSRKGANEAEIQAKRQGAGSVKRDSTIWEDFCQDRGYEFTAVRPAPGATKWSAETFKRITGWSKRTSEHARDAAVLVLGK